MFVRVILLVLVTPSGLVILIVIYNALKLTNILFIDYVHVLKNLPPEKVFRKLSPTNIK